MLPVATLVSTDRPVAVQGTLDDIAEEMLNGLFCHYEPPAKKKKHRGILRAPKMFRRSESNLTTVSEATSASKKGVRWSQRVEASYPKPPATEVHCNVIESVVDGCAEVGLVKSPTKAKEALAKYDLTELEKKHAMMAAKKAEESDYKKKKAAMRRAMEEDSSDSDDSGVVQSNKVRPPPPPPPPPPTNCGLITDICGAVHMKCGNTKDAFTPRESEGNDRQAVHRVEHHRRPKQPFDYLEGEDGKTGDGLIASVPSADSSVKSGSRFSSLKRIWPRKRGEKNGLNSLEGYESDPETRGRGRRRSPARKGVDPVITSKRGKSPSRGATNEDEDWDQSMPLFPGSKQEKYKRSSWLPKVSQSKNGRRASSPGPSRGVYSGSAERRNSVGETGKRSHSPSAGYIQESESFDRNLHSTKTFMGGTFPNNGSAINDSFERQSMITAYRNTFDPALSEAECNAMDDSDRQSYITAYRQGLGDRHTNDDMFDRQSFITASRQDAPSPLSAIPTDQRKWISDRENQHVVNGKASPRDRFSLRRSRSPSRRSRRQSPGRRSSSPLGNQLRMGPDVGSQQPLSALPFYSNQNVYGQNLHADKTGPYAYQSTLPYIPADAMQVYYGGATTHPSGVGHLHSGETPESKKAEELSWEERTRQAWERLRGSTTSIAEQLASSLMMNEPDKDKTSDANQTTQQGWSQGQHLAPHTPVGILKKNSQEKKVTFGPLEEQYYTDVHDENMSIYEAPSHEHRKRYKFRGTKILTEMFSKKKRNHSGSKKHIRGLHQSRSADMTASMSASMSRSWGEEGFHPSVHPYYSSHPHQPQYHPGSQPGNFHHHQEPAMFPQQSYVIQQQVPGQRTGYFYPPSQGNSFQNGIYNMQPAPLHQSPVRSIVQ
jgi:hypothetical protein